jgi:hypothetical protein
MGAGLVLAGGTVAVRLAPGGAGDADGPVPIAEADGVSGAAAVVQRTVGASASRIGGGRTDAAGPLGSALAGDPGPPDGTTRTTVMSRKPAAPDVA